MIRSGIQASAFPRIGKYDVEAEIGHGDLVRVFRAFDRDLGRAVTLKLLTDLADSALAKRFRAEVSCVGKLRTPNILAIYELGEHVGFPFASMQVLGDDDLQLALRANRPLSLLQKVLILWQIADGIREANLGGLPHVGLRPSGIALDQSGRATIRDFGIVRLHPETESEAAWYIAPEQLTEATPADILCDIFVFGAIGYELLTGTHPFLSGQDADAKIDFAQQPTSLRQLAPECPDELGQLIHRAIEKRRELRYQTVDELQDDAEPILRELKRRRSAELLTDAQALIDSHELEHAQAMMREVLQLDPENRKAHRLRADLRTILQAETVRPRVEALLRQAEGQASAGDFARAVELLETARSLDETDSQVQARLDELRSRVDRRRRCAELIVEARQFMERNAWNEAGTKVLEALEGDPANVDANELLRIIDEGIARQDREAKIEAGLAQAKSLLLLQEFNDAIATLVRVQTDCPGSPLVDHWLQHARNQLAEVDRQTRLQVRLRDAQSLITQRQFRQAVFELEGLSGEFPGEPRIAESLAQACQARDCEEAVSRAKSLCHQFRREEQFERALEVLDSTLAAWPQAVTLLRLRREVAQQWRELKSSVEIRKALLEVQWLLDQRRPDLASQFLHEKCREFPDQTGLSARLAEVDSILRDWEKGRLIQDTLRRVADLEQLQQWAVALTVIDEALERNPATAPLLEAAERLRNRVAGEDRRRKLARRLDAIARKIAEQSWTPALLLIESAQQEFPGEPELERLLQAAEDGRRRSAAENIVREVRQSLADVEPERAEEVLRRGMELLPGDPVLAELQQELTDSKRFREEWRAAQVCFARREFQKAEMILVQLAGEDRPEVDLLLLKVREARAVCDEDQFYTQGREKAVKLIQQQQIEQAADLLRNLLTLFPGDPILQRDLQSIQSETDDSLPAVLSQAHHETSDPSSDGKEAGPVAEVEAPARPILISYQFEPTAPFLRSRLAVIVAAVLLLAASSSAALWRFSRHIPVAVPAKVKPSPMPKEPVKAPDPSRTGASIDQPSAGRSSAKQGTNRAAAQTLIPPDVSSRRGPRPDIAANPERVDGRIEPARLMKEIRPVIPALARQQNLSGIVDLEATVDPEGKVTAVKVVSGHSALVSAARDAVLKWRYRPAILNGEPIETKVNVQVVFDKLVFDSGTGRQSESR